MSLRRRRRSDLRRVHKACLQDGSFEEDLPAPLTPELFSDISETYWSCLRRVADPRKESLSIYPLSLILHRIISGLLSGTRYIGVLFPKKQNQRDPEVTRQLGALPTRPAVYALLRRIDWEEANVVLAPLWKRLGYVPELVVERKLRDPQVILEEFRTEQQRQDQTRMQQIKQEREAQEKAQGMSAAAAKRTGVSKKRMASKQNLSHPSKPALSKESNASERTESFQKQERTDLLLDGKVVKASYNMEVQERFVHVTHTQLDSEGNRHRHIIGARETQFDRNGEWGAALSVLEALTPLSRKRDMLVSGDAGFCVREFCKWLTVVGFFLFLESNKMLERSLIVCWIGPPLLKKNIQRVTILNRQDWQEERFILVVFGESKDSSFLVILELEKLC